MNYKEALTYIYSFINYELVGLPPISPSSYNLERMDFLLQKLGNPQLKYSSIVIAGTKGKGSTAALCASVLEAAGKKTALYTQPHLQSFRERMQVNSHLIKPEELAKLVDKIQPLIGAAEAELEGKGSFSFYEVGTALALLYFAEKEVDVAVLEIGLGGRLDSVNVVEPVVSVITSISYDHMAVLGSTLTQIAGEKAGIIKKGVPVVCAPQQYEALEVIQKVSRDKKAELIMAAPVRILSDEVIPDKNNRWRKFQRIQLEEISQLLELPLLGEHQAQNAAVAAKVLQILASRDKRIKVSEQNISEGFRRVRWPGRLEVIRDQPGTPLIVVDGAHNAASAKMLRLALDQKNFFYKKIFLVLGTSSDKDVEGIFEELQFGSNNPPVFILTRSSNPRALPSLELAKRAFPHFTENSDYPEVITSESVKEALDIASRLATPLDLICFTGSLFVVGEIRDILGVEIRGDD